MANIELYNKLIQTPIESIRAAGEIISKSGWAGVDKSECGMAIMMTCLFEGITPLDYIRTYDTIGNKPRKKALAILAEFRKKGGKHKWIKTGDDATEAVIELTFEGEVIQSRFNIKDAERAQLIRKDSNWQKSPANMLRARAISNGVAMLCPEIVAGLSESDEESEPVIAPPKPLLPPKQAEQEPPKEKVIEAEIIQPAAEPEQKQESDKPEPAGIPAVDPKTGKLTMATALAIEKGLGDGAALVNDWNKARFKNYIDFRDIPIGRAAAYINAPAGAIKAAKDWKASLNQ